MKLHGGYNVLLAGKPSGQIEVLPEPESLYLPLKTPRFEFSEVCVEAGQQVRSGQALAKDPDNYSVPLIAPRSGTVRLGTVEGHIVLEEIARTDEEPYDPLEDELHVPKGIGSVGIKRYKLLALGGWQFFHDAHSRRLPDPFGTPRAVIISTLRLESFAARGDVQLHQGLTSFIRGLEQVQSLLEYQPIYLVLPDIQSELARKVREAIRGRAWVKLVQVPIRYPFDNFTVLARGLGFREDADSPVWALRTEGVLAADKALTLSSPCTTRIVSLGGPAVRAPVHLETVVGYPIEAMLKDRLSDGPVRVVNGGILTGQTVGEDQMGMDAECSGLTVLAEHVGRELFGFVRPGLDRRSYSNCFLSALRRAFHRSNTTALRGEPRPCIACGFCEEVCPAKIMPYLIHKCLYKDDLEQVVSSAVDLCVDCGLCSYVCPSKIELFGQILDAKDAIRRELHEIDGPDASESESLTEEARA